MVEIRNSAALTSIFGYWPTFHDAEVLSVLLDRAGREEWCGPSVEAKIHMFEMTSKVNEKGYYELRHHALVTFRFLNIDLFQANGFNHQNVIWGLEIIDVSERQLERIKFEVRFSPSFGLDLNFSCEAVEVVAVEPYTPAT